MQFDSSAGVPMRRLMISMLNQGAPFRGVHRTWDRILKGLHKMFVETVDPVTLGLPAEPEAEALAA